MSNPVTPATTTSTAPVAWFFFATQAALKLGVLSTGWWSLPQSPIDQDMGSDEFLPDVAWSWLIDALDTRQAQYVRSAGTTTTVLSTGFGDLASEGSGAQVEVRASWSPTTSDLGPHLEAWSEFVCMLAGFPPTDDGVSHLQPGRRAV